MVLKKWKDINYHLNDKTLGEVRELITPVILW
jgi:hypothetical protein